MKKLLTTALILISLASFSQQNYTIRGTSLTKLNAEYIQIRATNKMMSIDKWNLVVDFGKPNTGWNWKQMQLQLNGKVVKMDSPMNLVNIFAANGYDLVQMGTLSSQGATGSLFYVMRKVKVIE